jgi:outer membrane protein OmpA-like peptidoglycan-associated protein
LAKIVTQDSVNFNPPQMISQTINHLYYEGTPSVSSDGKTLYYAANASVAKKIKSKRKKEDHLREDGLNILKIFVAHKVDGKWTHPVELNINGEEYNTAFPHITENGKQLFFASDRPGGMGAMDIYVSNKINDSTWTEPKNLGTDVNSFENDLYPFLLDNKLFFSSKGHEGFGGSDIYSVDYTNKTPSNRKNLGAALNSSKDDFALILKNGRGYVSSNRDGLHGYDHIYHLKNINETQLLGMDTLQGEIIDEDSKQPLKDILVQLYEEQEDGSYKLMESLTTKDDGKWKFIVRPDKNYRVTFTHPDYEEKTVEIPVNDGNSPSNRDKILAQLNPLDFKKKDKEKDRLHGEIINKITNQAVPDVGVELYEKQANGNFVLVDQMTTKADGKWEFWVDKDKEYQVKFNKDQFDQNVVDIPANDGKTPSNRSKILAELNPFALNPEAKKDNVITINNLYFDFNQVSVQTKSMPILKNLLTYLKDNPEAKIELGAHTDAVGPEDYNLKLSQKRANYCRNYLINKGISKSRIKAQGYGESKILNGCENWNDCSEKENEINRRVEVKFL